jgi:hypothetical protein
MLSVLRGFALLLTLCLLLVGTVRAEDYSVAPVEALPDEAKADIGQALATPGFQVTGPDGPLCSLWLSKAPAVQEGFSPTLSVKQPFAQGAFMGLLKVEEGTKFTDFREQTLRPGLYTLRYARQPQDGNHIGTSDLSDFLLAIPAKDDQSPKTADDLDKFVGLAADAARSTHPAILALRPAEKAMPGEAKLVHDSGEDLWMVETALGSDKPQPLRLVVVGFALE